MHLKLQNETQTAKLNFWKAENLLFKLIQK